MKLLKLLLLLWTLLDIGGARVPMKSGKHLNLGKKVTFWQITDIHYDKFYVENGDDHKFCHQGLNSSSNAGKYGNFHCETNRFLLESAVREMAEINSKPDFILWTGDSSPHWRHPTNPDWEYIFKAEKLIMNMIRKYFPNTPIVPALGNHDSFAPDNFTANPDMAMNSPKKWYTDMYSNFVRETSWTDVLNPEEVESFSFCGYYTRTVDFGKQSLKIIVLNTNLYYKTQIEELDPCGQLKWMDDELLKAKQNGKKVIITGHVPPGFFERQVFGPFFQNKAGTKSNDVFVDIVLKYSNTIVAQIFGHTHTDSFRLVKSGEDYHRSSVILLAPSVTPLIDMETATNPGVRLFEYTAGGYHLDNYYQYYLDLEKANLYNVTDDEWPRWDRLYSFTEAFGVHDLSRESITIAALEIVMGKEFFQKIWAYNTLNHANKGDCDDNCKRNFVCAIENIKVDDMEKCMNSNQHPTGEKDAYEQFVALRRQYQISLIIGVVILSVLMYFIMKKILIAAYLSFEYGIDFYTAIMDYPNGLYESL